MEYAHYLPRDLVVSFLGLVFVSVVMRSLLMWQRRTRGKLLPPGPRHLPILGYLNAPKFKPWFAFKEMSTRYGSDILYFRRFGQHNIVLSDPSVITEYLVKRTTNTSDRVHSPSVTLSTLNRRLAFMPYAAEWSDCRRAFWQHFHPGALGRYKHVQLAVAHRFLLKLLEKPAGFQQHIRYTFAATILKITYGIDIDDENAEIVQVVENAGKGPGQTLIPGRFLVDSIPFLRFVPAWMPGAGFQRQFAEWGAASRKLKDFPYVRRNTAFTDNALPSCATIADTLLSEKGETGEYSSGIGQEDLVKTVCGAAYVAGADTTYSTLQAAFLALSLYPDVQRKAQAELFAVVGPDRLPDFGDREALVYVNALVKEMLRWFNVTPLGMAHRTMADDELNGYFIPAGTMITPNIWACMHDPAEYEDADEFRPERFIRDGKLDSTVRDPLAFAFGFGKRICPGRYFADTALFINVASVLHVFDITPPLDENGNPIRVKMEMSDGFISYPEDCRCTIRPRSEKAAALILKTQG
ncbi:O-methylsterigmatocystin oxidoreductase [Dichomitus squalens]|uniref:O-methylsterigmatocystin oxidoreductase n=1 Tax=Dichomitus squalens TaxID=114155 RepID=A0A4Q9M553_9APHY|nr:O-methylsterigmatocystin oxidoreductase [Dichomitus squalens]